MLVFVSESVTLGNMLKTDRTPERDETAQIVASNLAAELTRQRWSARAAASALGLTNVYVSRRVSGFVELSASDLALFANFLNIPVTKFFEGLNAESPASGETGLSIVGSKKATRGGALGGLSLPELDSNQQPAGFKLAPVISITKDHKPAARPVVTLQTGDARVTNIGAKAARA